MTEATVRVYLDGTGKGDAVRTFAEFSHDAIKRQFPIRVDDPVALQNGAGWFSVCVNRSNSPEAASAVVRAMLDNMLGGGEAFDVSTSHH